MRPAVSFYAPIAFGTSFNRIPPGVGVTVPVKAAGIPAGRTVALDVQGAGGGPGGFNGTAAVRPSRIAGGTSWVTVTGGAQTPPGRANRLRLRARIGGRTLATSSGFTVAAHPRNLTVRFNADVDTRNSVGLASTNGWASDGAHGVADLSEVDCAQQINVFSRHDPPFTSAVTAGTPGIIPGVASPIVDIHWYPRWKIRPPSFRMKRSRRRRGLPGGPLTRGGPLIRILRPGRPLRYRPAFKIVYQQLFVFDDHRTGLQGQTVPNSGFTITHTLTWNASRKAGRGGWDHQCVKTGAITQMFGYLAMPGAGTAASLVHPL